MSESPHNDRRQRDAALALSPERIAAHLDGLLKPPGSLGRLEALAARLCAIQQTLRPAARPRRVVLFVANHGVVAQGVSAWPQSVTRQMIAATRAGKSASAVLARQTGAQLHVIDVGTDGGSHDHAAQSQATSLDAEVVCFHQPIRPGTRNLFVEPALTPDEFAEAYAIGAAHARKAAEDGMPVVAAGEMGIGNTTAASCLAMLLADVPLQTAVGRGAGADDPTLARKRVVVEAAVARARRQFASDATAAIASVAGLEIAAMAGFVAAAADRRLTVVLDGFVATAAAAVAAHHQPGVTASLIAAHASAEPGHTRLLDHLGLDPFLDWQLRLGEATGALLLLPMLDAACAIVRDMGALADLPAD